MVGCASNFLNESGHWFFYQATIWSPTERRAKARFASLVENGPGGLLLPSTQLDVHVDVTASLDTVAVVSALPEDFRNFVIEADGTALADLDLGLNTLVESLPNGWTQITSHLPTSLALSETEITLRQEGSGPGATKTEIILGIVP